MDKRYEEALERARAGIPIDEVFPELKESEDERIRKELVNFIKQNSATPFALYDKFTPEQYIAYLERQKDLAAIPDELVKNYKFFCEQGGQELALLINAINGFNKQKEQKPAEWSEEDEKMIRFYEMDYNHQVGDWPAKKVVEMRLAFKDWLCVRLKSLRPQSQYHDTYYDIIHSILNMLKDMDFTQITPEHRVSLLNDIRVKCKNADECAAILDEPNWKPSEEQMNRLGSIVAALRKDYCDDMADFIASLYHDLQKLL